MSLSIRAVVETWGEHVTYLSLATPITELLEAIATQCDSDSDSSDYGDVEVVYIEKGAQFLRYLQATDPKEILDKLAGGDLLSTDSEEYERQRSDIQGLCDVAAAWWRSLGKDGSLRIYCD